MASPSPTPTPSPSLIIPINPEQPQIQLQSLLMALVHTYGLTDVLEALNNGMFAHFETDRKAEEVATPILEALGTAHTISRFVLSKEQQASSWSM